MPILFPDDETDGKFRSGILAFMRGAGRPDQMPAPPYQPQDAAPPTQGQRYEAERQAYLRGTPGRLKSALNGALQGFASGGGLVGAATGGAYGAIDPKRLQERRFNQERRPQILEQFAFEGADRAAQRQSDIDALTAAKTNAEIGNLQSEGAYRTGQLGVAQENVRRQGEVAQSQIDLNTARAEAARTGRTVVRDVVGEDGQVRTYQIAGNGEMTELGGSAKAAINTANIQSRQKIASQREANTNIRAAQRQANKPEKKFVSRSKILQYAQEQNISPSEAAARAKADGYVIVR